MNEELKVVIKAEISDLKKNVNEAKRTFSDFKDKVSKHTEKARKAFKVMGSGMVKVTKAVAAGMGVVAGAVIALGKKALESYGDYEQLVGGIETLFKNSSDTVLKNAQKAYKMQQMSANEYMELATSFSASLLQSLGGDTEKAAKYADLAITDMADNANKMGSTMESVKDAYKGFSKQNFTMLDNLKLGYGGTKEEMERLLKDAEKISGIKYDVSSYSDIVDAIHVVQKEMGITGTSSAEASKTIQGSINMTKSAYQNWVTGLMDSSADITALTQDLVDSALTVVKNVAPKIVTMLPHVTTGVSSLLQQLAPQISILLKELLPPLIKGVTGLINEVVAILPDLINIITSNLPLFIEGVLAIILGIVAALPELVMEISNAIPTLLPQIIKGINALIGGICKSLPALIEAIFSIIKNLFKGLFEYIKTSMFGRFVSDMGASISNAAKRAVSKLESMKDSIIGIFDRIKSGITNKINAAKDGVRNAIEKIKSFFNFTWSLPKLKMPHLKITGEFSISPPKVPKFAVDWYARGGVFDKPTLFTSGGRLGGLGEAGAEAIVPLENNTQWLDKIADRLSDKLGGGRNIVLQVDGKTFGQISVDSINALTKQTGNLPLVIV